MTEEEARAWLVARFPQDRVDRVTTYVDILRSEAERQNLISAATLPTLWARHIVDSAQLLDLAPDDWDHWVDIGSGAGLPGLVVAALSGRRVTLIEPRRLRVEFLRTCASILRLDQVEVVMSKAEAASVSGPADVISARAVAKLNDLLLMARGFADTRSIFLLPKGRSAQSEVALNRRSWQGTFHVKQSIVDPTSGIIVATQVAPR